ncbi:MAG TPA: hypothetical protein VNF68_13080, partial [Candidatus Baltobacteraceae bacterium]|nr:hypothetical protein [Candidatus Baltobacteraceae bacterium]
ERTLHNLAGSSVDEWLMENVRTVNAWEQLPSKSGTMLLTTSEGYQNMGGTDCANSNVILAFGGNGATPYATDPRTLWFGGQYAMYQKSGTNFLQGIGLAEFPIDPRSFQDPTVAIWP